MCLAAALVLLSARAHGQDKREAFALSHYIMGAMYDSQGDSEAAIKEYKHALRADYKNTAIHLNLALSYIKSSQIQKAIDQLDIASKLDPEAVEPHAILALLYSWQEKPKEANYEYEIALKNASKLQPANIDIYKNLGILYLHQKKLDAAKDTFRLIIEFSPQDAEAHFYLGNVYDGLKDRKQAEREFKKAIELKPDYHEALNYLGYMYVEDGRNLDEAGELIIRALEIEPENGAYIDSLGWFYFKQGKYGQALKELERASQLLEDPVIFDHLGDAYYKIGDAEKAKINWENSLRLDPGQDKVKEKLQGLEEGGLRQWNTAAPK